MAAALALAACANDDNRPPDGTDPATVATISATVGPVATGIGTEAPVITPDPAATPSPEGPLVVRASQLVGLAVVDQGGAPLGTVEEMWVDPEGTVSYLALEMGAAEGLTAIAWSALQPYPPALPDPLPRPTPTQRDALVFTGLRAEVESAQLWTPEMGASTVVHTENGEWPAPLQPLLPVGGAFTDINLVNGAGEDLGEVEDLLIDLRTGEAVYGVVDFGGFLGLAEHTVAVPWVRFDPSGGDAAEAAALQLELDRATIEQAPAFDPEVLPEFAAPAEQEWDRQWRDYWDTVGGI